MILKEAPDPWHFPRAPLAKQYLALFDKGANGYGLEDPELGRWCIGNST